MKALVAQGRAAQQHINTRNQHTKETNTNHRCKKITEYGIKHIMQVKHRVELFKYNTFTNPGGMKGRVCLWWLVGYIP